MRRLVRGFLVAVLVCASVAAQAQDVQRFPLPQGQPLNDKAEPPGSSSNTLADAAVIALLIAGSVAIYKSTGAPCACPSDTTRNGQACGGRSAWSKPGGAKPLCFVTDINAGMIAAYRASKIIPAVW
jgi:hypothetical protein